MVMKAVQLTTVRVICRINIYSLIHYFVVVATKTE